MSTAPSPLPWPSWPQSAVEHLFWLQKASAHASPIASSVLLAVFKLRLLPVAEATTATDPAIACIWIALAPTRFQQVAVAPLVAWLKLERVCAMVVPTATFRETHWWRQHTP
jgi:hypothetical protein